MPDNTVNVGPIRGAKINKRWDPKEWRPEYEAMAALAATGMPHSEIAARYGYTESWISSIMNSVKGKVVKQLIINKIREESSRGITSDRVKNLQEKAFRRIEEVIDDDDRAKLSPIAILNASMEILKRTGVMSGAEQDKIPIAGPVTNNTQNVQVNISSTDKKSIDEALQLADSVRLLHAPKQDE